MTRRIGLIALVFVFTLMIFAGYVIHQKQNRLASDLLSWIGSGFTTTQYDFVFEHVAKQMLRGTAYEGRINIDLPARNGFLNLYAVLRPALEKDQPSLACGCAYVPKLQAIICDAQFLHEFSRSIEIQDEQTDEAFAAAQRSLNAGYRRFLEHWAIGHEIGHFMLAHGTGQGITAEEQLQQPWGAQEEIDADVFMISRMGGDERLQADAFLALSQFVARQYGYLMQEQHPKTPGHAVFGPQLDVSVYAAKTSHPHWLVRATNLAQTTIKFYPKVEDTTGHFERVLSHVKQSRSRDNKRNSCTQFHVDEKLATFDGKFGIVGEMELIERLANAGHTELANRRLAYAKALLPKGADSEHRWAYAMLLEAWIALVAGDVQTGENLLAQSRSEYGRIIQIDVSSMTLLLQTEARLAYLKKTIGADKARLEAIFEKTFKMVNEELGKREPNERQLLESVLVFWRASVDIYGPMSPEALSYVHQFANRRVPPMVARTLFDEWLALGSRIDPRLSAGEGGKTDQLLFIRNLMNLSNDHFGALAYGEVGLKYLDKTSADQIALRAKYRIEIARDLLRVGELDSAVSLFREAVKFRQQYADEYDGEDSNEKVHRLHQVAVSANELGFALQQLHAFDESTEHLKSAFKIIVDHSIQDPAGMSAILQNLSTNALARGKFEGARTVAAEAMKIRESIGDDVGLNNSRLSLAFALHYLQREEEARQLFDDWLRVHEWTNDLTFNAKDHIAIIDGKKVSLSEVITRPDAQLPELSRLNDLLRNNSKSVREQIKAEVREGA